MGAPEELKMIKRLLELGVSYIVDDKEGVSPLDMAKADRDKGGLFE